MPTIGEIIKKHRQQSDMTQREFAEKLGVYQATVALWERDKVDPKLFSAICIADVFGITLDELVGRTVADNVQKEEKT